MNKKIISGFLMFALAVFSMSSFVACKDYDEDSYTDLKARLNGEITLREALAQQVSALQEALSKIKSCSCDPAKYASKDEFDKVELKLTEIEEAIKNLTPYDDKELVAKINQLNSWLLYVESLAKSDSVRIDNLEGQVAGWDKTITNLVSRVDSIIVELSKINTGELNDKIEKAQNTADSAANLAGLAMQKALEAFELAQRDSVRIDSLEKKFNELIIRDFSKEIDSLSAVTDSLAGEIDKIKEDIQKMVTGVLIQGTESPVIGYFNTPLDARALILAAYYGELDSPLEFPATTAKNYVNGDADFALWTDRNKAIIGNFSSVRGYIANQPAGIFVSTKNGKEFGNAGTLYLTVNPNTVDFADKKVTLETSLGNESYIELSELSHSTRELTFGFTRSEAADNGFYEAEATLAKQNIDKVKMNIDFAELQDRARDLLKEKNKSSVLSMGYALVSSCKDVLPAYGVKASWLDATTNTTHNVYSEYALATTAIKPFSYTFLKDFNASLPGEAKLQEIAGKILDKISDKLKLNLPDFSQYDPNIIIKDIVIDPTNPNVTVTIQGTLKDADGNDLYILVTDGHYRYYMKDETDPWVYNLDLGQWQTVNWNLVESVPLKIEDVNLYNTIKYVADQINARYGSTSPLADLLNDVIAIGDLSTTISDALTDVKSELNNLITRAYNKMNSFLSSVPNKALQPILVGKSGKKASLLSQALSNPTKVSSKELVLYPTSYSLELLAPAYKKFVAVTDVFNASTKTAVELSQAKTMANQANMGDNMKRVFDVDETCKFKGETGFIYEITYTAVDYHGKVAIKKFYVQF